MDRRRFLKALAAGLGATAVIGFDPVTRRWVTSAAARGPPNAFDEVPPLDGQLLTDLGSRVGSSHDKGNMVQVLPEAVLVAGSVEDVATMVRFCREHRIPVATRGQHHSTHGQGLTAGLVVDSSAFNEVFDIGDGRAVVGAGITYGELVEQAFERGWALRAHPGCLTLSLGGNLSMGGAPGDGNVGAIADSVLALQVVTGAGDIVECSETQDRDLFDAVLGGLGQYGIITRVTFALEPALPMVRVYLPTYVEASPFFADLRKLLDRGEVDQSYNVCFPPGSSLFAYQINAAVFFDPSSPPDDARILRDLSVPPELVPKRDVPYLEFVFDPDSKFAVLELAIQWSRLVKPWYDVWLPDDAVEEHVTDVVAELGPDDVGPGGVVLVFPYKGSKFRRPTLRVPDEGASDRIWLFDVLTASAAPGPNPRFAADKLARNGRWFERASALGGTRYPIGSIAFGQADWVRHYGEIWPDVQRRKRTYDPDNIMTPGLGIF